MNNGSSPKSQDKSQKMKKSKKLNEDSDKETVESKQVPENENPKTDAKEEEGSQEASDKKDKKEKVPENENPKTEAEEDKGSQEASDKKDKKEKGVGRCKKCKAKAKMMKKKLKEEADGEDEKQKQNTEKGDPKTDTNEEKGTSDVKDKKESSIITWRHKSTKKDKSHGKNLCSVNPPYQTARSMYHGPPNLSNPWNMYAPPRVLYPAFAKGPMYGQCAGGGGGPFQPYQTMNPAAAMYRGAIMSPYPPMAAMYPPYWQSRPLTDANPITRYTTYRDNYTTHRNNYSYFFI